ncbi:MAG: heme-dependent peroxidase [Armatimonadetes bacterium]|nr:heme-dependent peroxidase [Armatimonadota bacterium]
MSENHAPSTLEGSFVLHLLYSVDWSRWRALKPERRHDIAAETGALLSRLFERKDRSESGAVYEVAGHKGDLMLILFRETPAELTAAEKELAHTPLWDFLSPTYSYLSVVELSLHGVVERYRKKLEKLGLEEGSPEWDQALEGLLEKDREAQRERLYPVVPDARYLCFYPMNKLRGEHRNWFTLTEKERSRLMAGHGKTGRKYFGKVTQIISSSMGLDDYDWGVDLFADDALQFKKLIYEMRYDEVSAVYAEFGSFFVGARSDPFRLLLPETHSEREAVTAS